MKSENEKYELVMELISVTKQEMDGVSPAEKERLFHELISFAESEAKNMEITHKKSVLDAIKGMLNEKRRSEKEENKRIKLAKEIIKICNEEIESAKDIEQKRKLLNEMRSVFREEIECCSNTTH